MVDDEVTAAKLDPEKMAVLQEKIREMGDPNTPPEIPNWAEYDLDPNLAHLYAKAKFVNVEGDWKLVATITITEFVTRPWKKLGEEVTKMEASGEGWSMVYVTTNGVQWGVAVMKRSDFVALPMPTKLGEETIETTPVDESKASEWEKTVA